MRCPSLCDLPPAPPAKTGWPWTEETPRLPNVPPDGGSWPRISIVTPSYNQGPFIEETIRSVLLQGYPDLEYIIVDGGSTDETVRIIEKYGSWLTWWVSETDRGQSHAINKGLERATGAFAAYQNSDDIYRPGAFWTVTTHLADNSIDALFATPDIIDEQSQRRPPVCPIPETSIDRLIRFWWGPINILPSQGFFFRLSLVRSMGYFNEALHFKMDLDLICRLLESVPPERVRRLDDIVASYRICEGTKSGLMSSAGSAREGLLISKRYWSRYSEAEQKELAREARHGSTFMCMCRAHQALLDSRYFNAWSEILTAWAKTPLLLPSRWSLSMVLRSFGALFAGRRQSI
jgi:glycosyltransferase involved in cell wall biosynthesis